MERVISNETLIIFACTLAGIALFSMWSIFVKTKRPLLHKLYFYWWLSYATWIIPLMCMRLFTLEDVTALKVLDCLTQPGGSVSAPFYLCVAVTFVEGYERMQKWMCALFIPAIVTTLVVATNDLHQLQYVEFGVIRDNIKFGPYMMVSGVINYLFLIAGIVYVIRFAIKNQSVLYWKQCILFVISGLFPMIISIGATFIFELLKMESPFTIAATPLSFLVTIVLNGIAIYRFHVLDITPIATQHILEGISDGYVILSEDGLVLKYNKRFASLIAEKYGLIQNRHLSACINNEDISQRSPLYNIMTAVESSRQGETGISYEQAITEDMDGTPQKSYFVVSISPLEVSGKVSGFAVVFKDVTQLKDSMQRLQDSKARMMEQERLAFLGQMIGGLAHNLKTPIMSISGCAVAADALVDECEESILDDQVTEEDFREIYGEMREWLGKIKEATSYMSDIITAIKGQATNISADENSMFTMDEMIKRCRLLMRHELLNSRCSLKVEYDATKEISLQGDINNLVQVIDNLLSNAIYAQKQVGGGEIVFSITYDSEYLKIMIKDRGTGIDEKVKGKLFKNMVTSKGTMGTGLGLYISDAVIRGKFQGSMWAEDREGGGSIFGISIPLEIVHMKNAVIRNEDVNR